MVTMTICDICYETKEEYKEAEFRLFSEKYKIEDLDVCNDHYPRDPENYQIKDL